MNYPDFLMLTDQMSLKKISSQDSQICYEINIKRGVFWILAGKVKVKRNEHGECDVNLEDIETFEEAEKLKVRLKEIFDKIQ